MAMKHVKSEAQRQLAKGEKVMNEVGTLIALKGSLLTLENIDKRVKALENLVCLYIGKGTIHDKP